MLSDSVGGSMEGLRFKKMPSVARDGDMEGLRIKRPSVEKRRKPKHGDEVKEEEHVDVGKSTGKEDRRKRKHDDDDQVKEEPAAEGGKSRRKKGKRHDDQLKEEVGDMEALWVKRPSHAGYMEHLSFRCSVNTARRKQEEKRKKRIEELRALDTGSSKEEKGGKRKSPPPPPLMEPFLSYEVSDYMLYEPERGLLELDPNFDVDRFIPDPDLAAKFIASLKKSSAILADRLRQFRLNGYATFFPSWELTDDEKE